MDLRNLNEGQIVAIKLLAFYAELGYDALADDHRATATVAEEPLLRDEGIAAAKKCNARANECHTLFNRLLTLQQTGKAA
jgi:hypothetical protein